MENEKIKISTYTPARRIANKKYKQNHKDKVNEIGRIYYEKIKDNEEFKLRRKQYQKNCYQNRKARNKLLLDEGKLIII